MSTYAIRLKCCLMLHHDFSLNSGKVKVKKEGNICWKNLSSVQPFNHPRAGKYCWDVDG